MIATITDSPACRPELPRFMFVKVLSLLPRRVQVLSKFKVEDLKNKAARESITEALEQADANN